MNLSSRRTTFAVLAAIVLSASTAAAWWGLNAAGPGPQPYRPTTRYYTLEAFEVEWEIAPGLTYKAWTYNGTIPGPQIEAIAGDTVVVTLVNKLDTIASLHVHGLGYAISSDGSYESGAYAMPNQSYTYTFTADRRAIGTWMYHDHVAKSEAMDDEMGDMDGDEEMFMNSIEGIERGLYGAIVVRAPEERRADWEYVLFMDEYMPEFTNLTPPAGMEMYAGFNGKTWPDNPALFAYVGETVRFRLISIGTESHTFHLHGHKWFDADTGRWVDTKQVGPFETYTFVVTAGENGPGEWLYHCHDLMHLMEGMEGMFVVESR